MAVAPLGSSRSNAVIERCVVAKTLVFYFPSGAQSEGRGGRHCGNPRVWLTEVGRLRYETFSTAIGRHGAESGRVSVCDSKQPTTSLKQSR